MTIEGDEPALYLPGTDCARYQVAGQQAEDPATDERMVWDANFS